MEQCWYLDEGRCLRKTTLNSGQVDRYVEWPGNCYRHALGMERKCFSLEDKDAMVYIEDRGW